MKQNITLLLLLFFAAGYGQVTNQGRPASWQVQGIENVAAAIMPSFNSKALEEEDARNASNKEIPLRFAHEFNVNYSLQNSGSWYTLPNGDRIWRLHIVSQGAKTLHFWFRNFFLPEGATLYVYNNAHTDLLGAYDSRVNKSGAYFGTWPVQGDDMWLEYFEPKKQAGTGKLELFKVAHAYKSIRADGGGNLTTFSGHCNYDAECFVENIDNIKNISKHSVAFMVGSSEESGFICSGVLVNNTNNDGTPYVLSANHAWSPDVMYSFTFNWLNPNPACPSTTDIDAIPQLQTISGATLRARRHESDFMLLEINSPIPEEWGVVWAGWDKGLSAPAYTYSLHHPAGDIMKISYDDDPAISSDHEDGMFTWEVNWELGVTEGGSSGSPLFDDHGRVRGQLLGGTSGCNGNESNGGGDGYGRLNKSWNEGQTPDTRLKDWLDPTNTGAETVDAYPPQQIYAVVAKATLFDAGYEVCNTYAAPNIRLINYGTQQLTSVQISYTLNGNAPQVLNWSGSLATNQSTIVSLPDIQGQEGANFIMVELLNPNGQEDENNIDNLVTVSFMVYSTYEPQDVTFNLFTDNYASEISWDLTNEAGEVLYGVLEGAYENAQQYSQVFDLSPGCYTFVIRDGYGDGICCSRGQGFYTLTLADGQIIREGGNYQHSDMAVFKMEVPMGTVNTEGNALKIFPNPSSGTFVVSGNIALQSLDYEVYNSLGQQIKAGKFNGSDNAVSLAGTAAGVYVLKLSNGKGSYKLIKE